MNNYCDGWLEDDSKHSLKRAKERLGLSEKRARRLMDLARKRGVRYNDCRWSADRNFLEKRCDEEAEAVAYNGYCFIFQRQTMNCITVFALPKNFGKKKTQHKKCQEIKSYYNTLCFE